MPNNEDDKKAKAGFGSGLDRLLERQSREILCGIGGCKNGVAKKGDDCGAHDPPPKAPAKKRASTVKQDRAAVKKLALNSIAAPAPARIPTMQARPDHPRASHIKFEVPLKVISEANVSQREKWHTKNARVKTQRRTVALAFKVMGIALPLPRYKITLTRIAAQPLDSDNLRPALKHVRDEVAFILGIDDASPLVEWAYAQETATHSVVNKIDKNGQARKGRQYDYKVRIAIDPLN